MQYGVDVRLRSEKEEENGWLREEKRLYLLRIRTVDKQGLRDPWKDRKSSRRRRLASDWLGKSSAVSSASSTPSSKSSATVATLAALARPFYLPLSPKRCKLKDYRLVLLCKVSYSPTPTKRQRYYSIEIQIHKRSISPVTKVVICSSSTRHSFHNCPEFG